MNLTLFSLYILELFQGTPFAIRNSLLVKVAKRWPSKHESFICSCSLHKHTTPFIHMPFIHFAYETAVHTVIAYILFVLHVYVLSYLRI